MIKQPLSLIKTQKPERNILYGIIAVIALSPLYFGGDRPIPIAAINIFTGVFYIYWGFFAARNKHFVRISLRKIKWIALLTLIVLLWAILQALPLDLPSISNSFWNSTKQLLPDENIKSSVSITPLQSWLGFFKILAYIIIFWLTLQISRNRNNAVKILQAIALSGASYAFYGLIVQFFGLKSILWYDKIDYLDSLTSTFVNRNNYATYAGVVLVVSVALLLNSLFENTNQLKTHKFYKIIIRRIFTSSLPWLLITLIVLASLILSGSRAGISCSIIGILVLLLLNIFNSEIKNHRKIFTIFSALIAAMFLLLFLVGGHLASQRFMNISDDALFRGVIYRITLKAISDFPLTGTGLGSFADIFRAYSDKSSAIFGGTLTDHTHNSYLELMLELGIPAAAIFISVITVIFIKCLQASLKRKRDGYFPTIAASAVILIASHAFFDFSVQIPAVAIIFTILLAIGLAQIWSSQIDTSVASEDVKHLSVYYKISIKTSFILGTIILFAGLAQFYIYVTGNIDANKLKNTAYEEIQQAKIAGVLTKEGIEMLLQAQNNLGRSIKLSPVDSYSWAYLAYAKLLSGDDMAEVAKLLAVSASTGFYQPDLLAFRLKIIPVILAYASEEEKIIFNNQMELAKQLSVRKTEK